MAGRGSKGAVRLAGESRRKRSAWGSGASTRAWQARVRMVEGVANECKRGLKGAAGRGRPRPPRPGPGRKDTG